MPSLGQITRNRMLGIYETSLAEHSVKVDAGKFSVVFEGYIPSKVQLPDEFGAWLICKYSQPFSKQNQTRFTRITWLPDKIYPEGMEQQLALRLLRYLVFMYGDQ